MPEYSIVVCNLDMGETVERSLRSILNQTDDRYEIVVVDGGSTDDSLRALRSLSAEFNRLRVLCTADLRPHTLAADRNVGVREALGEHVLVQLDADDEFKSVIDDFVTIYEELRRHRDDDFFLSGHGINIAPREFLLSYGPYRERIDRAEDADLWRRLLADKAFIQLAHRPVCTPIGYEPNTRQLVRQRLSEIEGDLLSGVTILSRLKRAFTDRPPKMTVLELILLPFAIVRVSRRKRYTLPEPYDDACKLPLAIRHSERSLDDLRRIYPSFSVELSDEAQSAFRV